MSAKKDELAKDLLQIIRESQSPTKPTDINHPFGMDLINKDLLMQKLVIFISSRDTKIFDHAYARAKARYIDKNKGANQ